MHLALEMKHSRSTDIFGRPTDTEHKSLQEIVNICNLPDKRILKRFVDKHSHLIYIGHDYEFNFGDLRRCVLVYYVPRWLRGLFFDPNRSRSLYSSSWVINKCQRAITSLIEPDCVFDFKSLLSFFMPTNFGESSYASRLLEHIRNGSDSSHLLFFLSRLSEIHWLDVYTAGWEQRHLTNGIVHWLCTTLVSRFLVSQFDNLLTAIKYRNRRHGNLALFETQCTRSLL